MKFYYVYRISCTHPDSTEKYYYGSRVSARPPTEDTYWSSSRTVKAAIGRYGLSCFTKKIVAIYADRRAALAREVRMHAYWNVKDNPAFFNRANQSSTKFTTSAGPLPPATKAKLSTAKKARYAAMTLEEKAALWAAQRSGQEAVGWTGRLLSKETKTKMGDASRGKSKSPAHREAIRQGRLGTKASATALINMAAAQQKRANRRRGWARQVGIILAYGPTQPTWALAFWTAPWTS
jgi:hypothetical protein